jgi:hypothetical protein
MRVQKRDTRQSTQIKSAFSDFVVSTAVVFPTFVPTCRPKAALSSRTGYGAQL